MTPIRVFCGFDSREAVAYHVCCHSLLRHASVPISITPIALTNLRGIYTRERGPTESTEFSISRFLTPYLSGFEGFSIFCDSDMLWLDDVAKLTDLVYDCIVCQPGECEDYEAVWVVKHDYTPRLDVKMDGKIQTRYPKKNWSSLIVFNNSRCGALTPDYVNTASGLDLHRFNWLPEDKVGSLPPEWNVLVGEENQSERPSVVHFTNGIPSMPGHEKDQYADLWFEERRLAGL